MLKVARPQACGKDKTRDKNPTVLVRVDIAGELSESDIWDKFNDGFIIVNQMFDQHVRSSVTVAHSVNIAPAVQGWRAADSTLTLRHGRPPPRTPRVCFPLLGV